MKLTSRQKIMFGVYAMILAMIGDYLLGYHTISTSSDPDYLGMTFHVVGDWRYALSSVLGFVSAAFFAIGALELMKVMEEKLHLKQSKLYFLFKIANWSGILYFAFVHIGICMLPVIFNAGMEISGEIPVSVNMALRVAKSIAVPMIIAFILSDGLVTISWTLLVLKEKIPGL